MMAAGNYRKKVALSFLLELRKENLEKLVVIVRERVEKK
mgnify:CR=1 FL=1